MTKLSFQARIAKYGMNLFPNKPQYQETHFEGGEIFRHPNYLSKSQTDKEALIGRLIKRDMEVGEKRPFDLYFPSFPFNLFLKGKRVLDLGCGIGGQTILQGEKWGVKEIVGLDVNSTMISSINRFLDNYEAKNKMEFIESYAEKMPFKNERFDAIVSANTLEHVRSVKVTLTECKRVLRKGGVAFLVFPSILFPIGGAHVSSATKTPFLEWCFSIKSINEAYLDIIKEWGDDLNWYKPKEETRGDWAVAKAGIGINGTKYKDFIRAAENVGFSGISYVKIPLLSVSNIAVKYPILNFFTSLLKPLLVIDHFKDYFSHRLVFVLKK